MPSDKPAEFRSHESAILLTKNSKETDSKIIIRQDLSEEDLSHHNSLQSQKPVVELRLYKTGDDQKYSKSGELQLNKADLNSDERTKTDTLNSADRQAILELNQDAIFDLNLHQLAIANNVVSNALQETQHALSNLFIFRNLKSGRAASTQIKAPGRSSSPGAPDLL